MKGLLEDYNALGRVVSLPALRLVTLTVTGPERLDTAAAAKRLDHESRGWARHRSGARRLPQPAAADFGPPLFAEWVEDGGAASGKIAPHPYEPGALALWRYAEGAGAGALEVLAQDVAVLDRDFRSRDGATPLKQPLLLYRVYWGAPAGDSSAVRRLLTRFLGFSERSEFAGRPIVIR